MTSLLSPCVLYTRFYPPVAKLTTLPFAPRTGRVVGAGFKPAPSQRGCAKFNATNYPTTTDVTVIPDSPRHSRKPTSFPRTPLRHSRGRGNPAKNKARHSQHPTPKTESSACFPICTPIQNKALYQHIYGTSQLYFPLSLDSYRAVVLAFSLYKLVSDRRIWTPIKPRFDEGIKELR